MRHAISEVPRRDLSNVLLTKPFEKSPIGILEAPSNRFEIANIPIALGDHVSVFGQTLDRKMVEGELPVDSSFFPEKTQCGLRAKRKRPRQRERAAQPCNGRATDD